MKNYSSFRNGAYHVQSLEKHGRHSGTEWQRENVALIIDRIAGKSYVLCPAGWFEVPELTQLEVMVKNAVRYVSEVDDSDLSGNSPRP